MLENALSQMMSMAVPFIIFLAVFSFIFAALGRSKIFHFERGARAVLSFALAFFTAQIIGIGWNQIISITSVAVVIGLSGLVLYHIGFQRGKTRHESLERIDE